MALLKEVSLSAFNAEPECFALLKRPRIKRVLAAQRRCVSTAVLRFVVGAKCCKDEIPELSLSDGEVEKLFTRF